MFSLFLIFALFGILIFDSSIQEMKNFLATRNESFSFGMMQNLDQYIEKRIGDFKELSKLNLIQETLIESNVKFQRLQDIKAYLQLQEEQIEFESGTTPFIKDVLDEELTEELIDIIGFYKDEYDYDVIEEFFVTNAYGANVALATGTSDYRQDDEQWWQDTKDYGISFSDVEFLENYGSYSVAFGFRVDDNNGNFIGVIRALITLDDLLSEFSEEAKLITNENRNVILLDDTGKIIYSNGNIIATEEIQASYFDLISQQNDVGFLELEDQEDDIRLVSFAQSTGYRTFEGLGWTVIVEQNDSSIVNEFVLVRDSIILSSVVGMFASIILGIIISFFISDPLKRLSKISKAISEGNFKIKTKKSKIDEIRIIEKSFNKMSDSLEKLIETEKQLAEANVKIKNERLAAMGELAASMAHDMKNPLATIRSSAEIIKRSQQGRSDEIEQVIARMDRSIERMSHQIEDVLNFVRLTPLNIKKINVRKLLDSAIESLSIPQSIKLNLPSGEDEITCDPQKIEIVTINLILNAIQAIGKNDGIITVRISEDQKNNILEFENSGPEISKDFITKIFEPLVTTKQKGTGLGLSISKNIVEQHGGTISARNKPTTFTIKLPKKLE